MRSATVSAAAETRGRYTEPDAVGAGEALRQVWQLGDVPVPQPDRLGNAEHVTRRREVDPLVADVAGSVSSEREEQLGPATLRPPGGQHPLALEVERRGVQRQDSVRGRRQVDQGQQVRDRATRRSQTISQRWPAVSSSRRARAPMPCRPRNR